jgi:O-acetyl-ADP-ribose deacetylase (regulator of RNase III)
MSFREVEGDLFEQGLPAIGHGVNCFGAMGAGIAKVFRDRYPGMYAAYSLLCDKGEISLGGIMIWKEANVTIYNLATQFLPGAEATLPAVKNSVSLAIRNCYYENIPAIGLPRIGCGIGGLNWPDVKAIMEKAAWEFPAVDVVAVTLPANP